MPRIRPTLWSLWAVGATLLSLGGCSSYVDHLRYARSEYFTGQFDMAEKRVTSAMRFPGQNKDMYKLESAMIQLQTGKPHEAEVTLRQVRDSFDHLEQTSIGENALSMLSDDTVRAYAG